MPSRHRSRRRALQVLYQWDMRRQPVDDAISAFYSSLYAEEGEPRRPARDEFMETLARGTAANAERIDHTIKEKSAHWRIERMPVVDRNLLRMGVYEMTQLNTPPAVVIDEALELARQFSGEESVSFINGVLDAVRRDLE
ncbi:MAG TPA: transcription antitermination factor NusB [Bryobacteraceae bacterium]|jgi:N utilization substance protein B|nr:transcription antitermination factor NusB [Bryobacteraceae bacterium]